MCWPGELGLRPRAPLPAQPCDGPETQWLPLLLVRFLICKTFVFDVEMMTLLLSLSFLHLAVSTIP